MGLIAALRSVFGGACSTKNVMDEFHKVRGRVAEKAALVADDADAMVERNGFAHAARRMRERGAAVQAKRKKK